MSGTSQRARQWAAVTLSSLTFAAPEENQERSLQMKWVHGAALGSCRMVGCSQVSDDLIFLFCSFTKSVLPAPSTRTKGHGEFFPAGEEHCACSDLEETQGAGRKNRNSRGLSRVSAGERPPPVCLSVRLPPPPICAPTFLSPTGPSVRPSMCGDHLQCSLIECKVLLSHHRSASVRKGLSSPADGPAGECQCGHALGLSP